MVSFLQISSRLSLVPILPGLQVLLHWLSGVPFSVSVSILSIPVLKSFFVAFFHFRKIKYVFGGKNIHNKSFVACELDGKNESTLTLWFCGQSKDVKTCGTLDLPKPGEREKVGSGYEITNLVFFFFIRKASCQRLKGGQKKLPT